MWSDDQWLRQGRDNDAVRAMKQRDEEEAVKKHVSGVVRAYIEAGGEVTVVGGDPSDPIADEIGKVSQAIEPTATQAWKNSLSESGKTITWGGKKQPLYNTEEWGFNIADENGEFKANRLQRGGQYEADDGTKQGNSIVIRNDFTKGQRRKGSYHTHSQANGQGSPPSVAFGTTPGDLFLLRGEAQANNNGFMMFVDAGDTRYVLYLANAGLAAEFLKIGNQASQINLYNQNLKEGSSQGQINAILSIIGNGAESGIYLYQSVNGSRHSYERVLPK